MTIESQFNLNNEVLDFRHITNIKDMPDFEVNPFTKDFKYKKKPYYDKIDNISIKIGDKEITNQDFKEHNIVLAEKLYKDNEPFCKFFFNTDLDITNLNPSACKLLIHIMSSKLNINMDFIFINSRTITKELNMSINTIYNGILNLLQYNIIMKRKDANMYWINPHIIFRGDRKKIRFNN